MDSERTLRSEFRHALDEVLPPAPWLEATVVEDLRTRRSGRSTDLGLGRSGIAWRRPAGRATRPWLVGVRGAGAFAAVLLVLLLIVTLFVGDRVWQDFNSRPATSGSGVKSPALAVVRPVHVVAVIKVDTKAGFMGLGSGSVWLTGCVASTISVCDNGGGSSVVSRVDARTNRVVATIPAAFSGLAAVDSAVWVADELNNTLIRIDPQTNKVVATIGVGQGPHGVAIGEGAIWVANLGGSISRVDPTTNRVDATIALPSGAFVQRIAVGYGSVWVPSGDGRLFRIDPKTNRIAAIVSIPLDAMDATVGDGAVWVDINPGLAGGSAPGSVVRVDPTNNRVVATIPVGHSPNGIAVGDGFVWVSNQEDGTVMRIDAAINQVVGKAIHTGRAPVSIAIGEGAVCIADNRDGTLTRVLP